MRKTFLSTKKRKMVIIFQTIIGFSIFSFLTVGILSSVLSSMLNLNRLVGVSIGLLIVVIVVSISIITYNPLEKIILDEDAIYFIYKKGNKKSYKYEEHNFEFLEKRKRHSGILIDREFNIYDRATNQKVETLIDLAVFEKADAEYIREYLMTRVIPN